MALYSFINKNMGIKDLNTFLKKQASKGIQLRSFELLRNKPVAVDISIYMYRYSTNNLLIENIYLMLLMFRKYEVKPIFIFDGKPPAEKKDLIIQRRINRIEAKEEYDKLLTEVVINKHYLQDLKRKTLKIKPEEFSIVKRLIYSFGFPYYDAPNEADEVCAMLCKTNKVWGCISEDTDMFVYGCTNVIKYMSLLNRTCVHYHLPTILSSLHLTLNEFQKICILSGTDYNINNNFTSDDIYTIHDKYHKEENKEIDLYVNQFLQTEESKLQFKRILDMMTLTDNILVSVFDNIIMQNKRISDNELKENADILDILSKNRFIFPIKKSPITA